ncbi:S-adenosyl-L-methionine-dependent tRNA 4-demethylwyosine synthase-like [Iris pallida]|uniref:S-adenosyl-L-methionine-dependent tRNA 4-demethylwyosine synthase-like n=1 Tax=Iris pallida TaxID=29817 RepID=A0AAX6GWV3_IRIPA|nr:S-adenosyl-L-methionine-dependent tRNA 4-demethylwyosine synthase-like [Iris pallida]
MAMLFIFQTMVSERIRVYYRQGRYTILSSILCYDGAMRLTEVNVPTTSLMTTARLTAA